MRCLRFGNASLAISFRAGGRLFTGEACRKLFVGGLSYDTNETALKDVFEKHGEVLDVNVICDRVSGKSKGFGFIKFALASDASTALQKMDGQILDGRCLRIAYAKKE